MGERLSRRSFLKGTALSAAVAASGTGLAWAPRSARAGTNTGRIRKAMKYHNVQVPGTVEQRFRVLKEIGFDGVEVHTRLKIDPAEFVRASERTGLPIHGVINSTNPDLKSAIDLAKTLGGTSVLVVAGRVTEKVPYDVNYRQTQELYRRNIEYAEKQRIHLLVENVWNNFLLSPLEMARFIDEIDSPYFGAYFDVGNVVRIGYPEQWIRILGKRIGKLDIKEYSRDKQRNEGLWKGFNVPIGEGSIDWAAVRKALAEIGYEGWASAEVGNADRDRLADIARRMDRVLDL